MITFFTHNREYADNIRVADRIVENVENLIKRFYNDDNTAFIFTSDHGMTDWGRYNINQSAISH